MNMHPTLKQFFEEKERSYPVHLETKHPRVFDKIIKLWGSLEADDYMAGLMVDDRGGRQGFPPDVLNNILMLSRIHARVLELKNISRPKGNDPFAERVAKAATEAGQIAFNAAGFARAMETDNVRVVKLFVQGFIGLEEKDAGGSTPLMRAATLNATSVAAMLVEAKANVNVGDAQGLTPLHWAAFKGHPEMAKLLVEKGADVNAKSKLGLTPLMQATVWGHGGIVTYLLSKGARVNEADNDGLTALHAAVSDGHVAVVEALLAAGADPSAKSAKGLTPAIIAQNKKNPAILAVLFKPASPAL